MTAIATVAVATRLYTRIYIANQVGVDDILAVGALLSTIGLNVVQSVTALDYLPLLADGSSSAFGVYNKYFYAYQILYNTAMAFVKMTFLFQFFRIFRYVPTMRFVYIIAIVLVGIWSISQVMINVISCTPAGATWNKLAYPNAKCVSPNFLTRGTAIGSIVTDIIVLFLPLPTLWSLRLRASQKWAAFGVFGVGAIVPIISAGRLWSVITPPPAGYLNTACWSTAELAAGIVTAALGTIRLLISRHFPALPTTQSNSGSNYLATFSSGKLQLSRSKGIKPKHDGASEVELFDGISSSRNRSDSKDLRKKPNAGSWLDRNSFDGEDADYPANAHFGARTEVTSGTPNKTMSAGAAEFLGEFGIRVEVAWEVQEEIIRR
ncbi:hypothetical protein BX600DRAFT_516895 [Xylariales sp. PMI_506]|nr:hypothetical protein BX600DRAFT_516895 [Xylariales sp. PMI_506]